MKKDVFASLKERGITPIQLKEAIYEILVAIDPTERLEMVNRIPMVMVNRNPIRMVNRIPISGELLYSFRKLYRRGNDKRKNVRKGSTF